MIKYFDSVLRTTGGPYPNVVVTVLLFPSEALAPIYTDDGSGLIAGSEVTTDARGFFEFFCDPGRYILEFGVDNAIQRTIVNVDVGGIQVLEDLDSAAAAGEGAGLIAASQSVTYTAGTLGASYNQFPSIHDAPFNAVGDGTTLDDTAFAAAAALGRTISLTPGKTYYLSARVNMQTGSKFLCPGRCTVKVKTGPGGYNNVDTSLKGSQALFWFSVVDNNALAGIDFTTDGVKEVTIYPIRVSGGMATKGIDINRITVTGFSGLNGAYISINSVGAGAYRINDVNFINCGTAQGNSYWTGGMQITGVEIDNDLLASVHSEPGTMYNIRCTNLLLTGQALTDYGQQTDLINVAGSSTTARKGPTVVGIYADGVGEVVDTFGSFGIYTGIRARNVHHWVGKFIHGAQGNSMQIDTVESCGLGVVTFAGSSSAAQHTQDNAVVVKTARGIGDSGTGPAAANAAVVQILENGGLIGTCLPQHNYCEVQECVGTANFDNVVYDNCTVDNANGNRVEVHQARGYVGKFCSVVRLANTKVRYKAANACRLTQTNNQSLASGVDVVLPYDVAQPASTGDIDGIYFGSNTIRPKFPGWYQVNVKVRVGSVVSATDYIILTLLKNGGDAEIRNVAYGMVGASIESCPAMSALVYVGEQEVGTTSADYTIQARHVAAAAGTVTATNAVNYTLFEMSPVAG